MWIEIAAVWLYGEEFLERYNFLKNFFNIELREVNVDNRGTIQKKAFIEIKSLDDFLKLSNVLRDNRNEKDRFSWLTVTTIGSWKSTMATVNKFK